MNKKTILFIEDDENDINFVLNALKEDKSFLNYLIVAYDGKEALQYLLIDGGSENKHIKYYPDLIILDLKLPHLGGIEVLSKIKENKNTKNIPIVVFTASEDMDKLKKSYDLGVNSFVKKPIIYQDFINTVKKIIDYWLEVNLPLAREL